jgi:6-phosphogluconolactonase
VGAGAEAGSYLPVYPGDDGFLAAQEPAEVTTVEGAGPRHMVFHPNQQYGYCVNELNSSVDVWELKDPHGKLNACRRWI